MTQLLVPKSLYVLKKLGDGRRGKGGRGGGCWSEHAPLSEILEICFMVSKKEDVIIIESFNFGMKPFPSSFDTPFDIIIHKSKQNSSIILKAGWINPSLSITWAIHSYISQSTLSHKVKTQYVHLTSHTEYFLLHRKIPEEISRRLMLFHNWREYLPYQTYVHTTF